jgi:hypothetical protein
MFKKALSLLADFLVWNVMSLAWTLSGYTAALTMAGIPMGLLLSAWGLVLLVHASGLLGLICLFVQPTPFVIGVLMLFHIDGATWLQAHLHLPL